ncbi:MAG: hypothetical protein CYG59_10935 [Chloroflexi bacterium]|nr:MAG: hypothetical protein CYG59_10935 [Chloroflexota bacterium]
MAERMTELDLVVGSMITTTPEEDRDAYEEEREWLQDVQDLLREEGIELDLLAQPGTEVWEGGIESFYDLYQLRRLAAHLERGDNINGLLRDESPDGEDVDNLLADIWDDEVSTRFPHLIKHQGDGGYYLPADFAEPIWVDYGEEEDDEEESMNEDTAVSFGSSVGLMRELTEVEQLFQQANVPPGGPRNALEVLRTAAQHSIDNGLPIILW